MIEIAALDGTLPLRRITDETLGWWGACREDRAKFNRTFPDGMALTGANIDRLLARQIDVAWGLLHLLRFRDGAPAVRALTAGLTGTWFAQLGLAAPILAENADTAEPFGAILAACIARDWYRIGRAAHGLQDVLRSDRGWLGDHTSEEAGANWYRALDRVIYCAGFGQEDQEINGHIASFAGLIVQVDAALVGRMDRHMARRPTQVQVVGLLRARFGI